MSTRRTVRALAATAAVAATVTLAPTAQAETVRVDDGADATASTTDLRTVRVTHGERRVRVQVGFPDLRTDGAAGLMTYLDADPEQQGPEFAIGVPLFSGGDYTLVRTDRWRPVDEPVDCRYGLQLDYAEDRMVLTAARGCFEKPDRLRVGMRMVDQADSSHPVTDWLLGRRKFTSWVAVGTPMPDPEG